MATNGQIAMDLTVGSWWNAKGGRYLNEAQMKGELQAAGIYVHPNAGWDGLHKEYMRFKRGLRSYVGMSVVDIRSESVQRGVGGEEGNVMLLSKAGLRRLLEAADEARVLDWDQALAKLPVEMIKRITELSMEHFPGALYAPAQPPMSKVCGSMRYYALSTWYATIKFELLVELKENPERWLWSDRSDRFLTHTTPDHLSLIRHVRLVTGERKRARGERGNGSFKRQPFAFEIDLGPMPKDKARVCLLDGTGHYKGTEMPAHVHRMRSGLEKVVQQLAKEIAFADDNDYHCILANYDDFWKLKKALEEGYAAAA